MSSFLEHLMTYKFLYIAMIALIILVAILVIILKNKNKKVAPINMEEIVSDDEKSDLEEMIEAMESSLNERQMTTFEQEQEENAIISYQELVAAVNEKKAQMTPVTGETEQEEMTNSEPQKMVLEEVTSEKKFKNSEFISPIFGKDSNNSNDDFLKELKDFRKNL